MMKTELAFQVVWDALHQAREAQECADPDCDNSAQWDDITAAMDALAIAAGFPGGTLQVMGDA